MSLCMTGVHAWFGCAGKREKNMIQIHGLQLPKSNAEQISFQPGGVAEKLE